MQNLPAILSAVVLLGALFTVIFAARRLKRARREFEEEVAAWRLGPEPSLQQARRERDQLLDALDDALLLLDSDHRVLFANRAASTMFPQRELRGLHIDEVFLDERLREAFVRSLEPGGNSATRILLPLDSPPVSATDPQGVHAWILDAARISENPSGHTTTRVVIRDVSGEHQIEQIRKDFVANASHELRTPLAIINGYLENLLDDDLLEDSDLARHFLGIMRKHTRRIVRIVEDMLVISRLESGESAALKIKPFRVRKCLVDVLDRLESIIRARGVTVVLEMPDESLKLVGDRFYWTQVIFNLVENALKQNPHEGLTITIGCVREEGQTRLWISDNGIGIPADDLPHIFHRFYRVEKQHSREVIEGTGLGLSIVKRAIEAHGGTIQVTSTPNVETRFTIRIPKAAQKLLRREFEEGRRKLAREQALQSGPVSGSSPAARAE